MIITKPVAVIVKDRKYLVARDRGEIFFKNVGGRIKDNETDFECLKRNLEAELRINITEEPKLIFELPPTPAQGDFGDEVILRGYLISENLDSKPEVGGDTEEIAWIDSENQEDFELTPQIKEFILPKLLQMRLIV